LTRLLAWARLHHLRTQHSQRFSRDHPFFQDYGEKGSYAASMVWLLSQNLIILPPPGKYAKHFLLLIPCKRKWLCWWIFSYDQLSTQTRLQATL